MRVNLRNGKLIPPLSLAEGIKRRAVLQREVDRVITQLNDPSRHARYLDINEYSQWCVKARHVRDLFETEYRQLCTWIEEQEGSLFRRAYSLIKTLQVDLEGDFAPEENILIEELDSYFKPTENKLAVVK